MIECVEAQATKIFIDDDELTARCRKIELATNMGGAFAVDYDLTLRHFSKATLSIDGDVQIIRFSSSDEITASRYLDIYWQAAEQFRRAISG